MSTTSSSSLDTLGNPPDSRFLSHFVFILKSRVLPEAEALTLSGLDDLLMLNLRNHIACLLFNLICLDADGQVPNSQKDDVFGGSRLASASNSLEHIKWAVQVLAGWYMAGTTMSWKAVLEATLRQLVGISIITNHNMAQIPTDTRRMANIGSCFTVFAQAYARRCQGECHVVDFSFFQ